MQLLQKIQTLTDAPEEKSCIKRLKLLNLKIRVNLTYFVFCETCNSLV